MAARSANSSCVQPFPRRRDFMRSASCRRIWVSETANPHGSQNRGEILYDSYNNELCQRTCPGGIQGQIVNELSTGGWRRQALAGAFCSLRSWFLCLNGTTAMFTGAVSSKSGSASSYSTDKPRQSQQSYAKTTNAGHSGSGIGYICLLLIVIGMGKVGFDEWNSLPPGTQCTVTRDSYGVTNLSGAYNGLQKAKVAKDEFGLAELSTRETAVVIPAQTACLVIDTNFF